MMNQVMNFLKTPKEFKNMASDKKEPNPSDRKKKPRQHDSGEKKGPYENAFTNKAMAFFWIEYAKRNAMTTDGERYEKAKSLYEDIIKDISLKECFKNDPICKIAFIDHFPQQKYSETPKEYSFLCCNTNNGVELECLRYSKKIAKKIIEFKYLSESMLKKYHACDVDFFTYIDIKQFFLDWLYFETRIPVEEGTFFIDKYKYIQKQIPKQKPESEEKPDSEIYIFNLFPDCWSRIKNNIQKKACLISQIEPAQEREIDLKLMVHISNPDFKIEEARDIFTVFIEMHILRLCQNKLISDEKCLSSGIFEQTKTLTENKKDPILIQKFRGDSIKKRLIGLLFWDYKNLEKLSTKKSHEAFNKLIKEGEDQLIKREIEKLIKKEIEKLTENERQKLIKKKIEKLTENERQKLIKEGMRKFLKKKIDKLLKEGIRKFLKKQIDKLTENEIAKLTENEIATLIENEIATLIEREIEKLTEKERAKLIEKEIETLIEKELEKFTKKKKEKLIESERQKLTEKEIEELIKKNESNFFSYNDYYEALKNAEDNITNFNQNILS